MDDKKRKAMWAKYHANKKKNPPPIITPKSYFGKSSSITSHLKNVCAYCNKAKATVNFRGRPSCKQCRTNIWEQTGGLAEKVEHHMRHGESEDIAFQYAKEDLGYKR